MEKFKWVKVELDEKETYAKEKYYCTYDTKIMLYKWHDDSYKAIGNCYICDLDAKTLEEAKKETISWLIERINVNIENKRNEIEKIKEKINEMEKLKRDLKEM